MTCSATSEKLTAEYLLVSSTGLCLLQELIEMLVVQLSGMILANKELISTFSLLLPSVKK